MKRVLILGIRAPIAHDLVKSFSHAGFKVFGADCFIPSTIKPLLSKENIATYFGPATDFEAFEKDAIAIVKAFKPDVIIPSNEEVFYWAKLAKKHQIPLFAPSLEQLMLLHSKIQFANFCQDIGLLFPKTDYYNEDCELKDKVLKPEYSRFGEMALIRPKSKPKTKQSDNKYIVQDYIEGQDVSFYAIALNGKITAFSAYDSPWRTKGGASLFFRPFYDEVLFEKAKKLCGELKLTGQISCDLRRDKHGLYWFIECNPRGTSGLHNIAINKDFTKAFFETEELVLPNQQSAKIGLAMLVYSLPQAVFQNSITKFFDDFSNARDVFEGNFFNLIKDTTKYFKNALLKRMSVSSYLTHDIECNNDLSKR